MKTTIPGNIICMDNQLLPYDIHFSIEVDYPLIKYFTFKKNRENIKNMIEYIIKDIVSQNNIKIFVRDLLNDDQKQWSRFIDVIKTQNNEIKIKNDIFYQLKIELYKQFKLNVIDCKIINFSICSSLENTLR